ncbi:MAG: class I SAM-dependent methyltransferase [Streptomycetales bacterium]
MGTWISTRTGQFSFFDAQLAHPDWSGKRVLDFGGNVGNLLLDSEGHIQQKNYWSIDVSQDAIPEGQRRHPDAHFIFYDRYNFEYNPFGKPGAPIPEDDTRFDVIVAWSVFTHTSQAEMLELVDNLQSLLADGGSLAFTFLDPSWTPAPAWARDDEAPGLSNLAWRLEARRKVNPSVDVNELLARAARQKLTWVTLVNDDELYFGPGDDGISTDKPQRAYITFATRQYMQQLFPDARILPPVPPERHHCVVINGAGTPGI